MLNLAFWDLLLAAAFRRVRQFAFSVTRLQPASYQLPAVLRLLQLQHQPPAQLNQHVLWYAN
jgi:hypothetical protein